jgi:histidine triad (HIT) family protein
MLARFAFRMAGTGFGRFIIAQVFAKMDFLIPVKRLRDTPHLLAFHHPQPAYPLHILIVPKRSLKGLQDLTIADQELLSEIFQTVQSLVAEFNLEPAGYRLVVNGGVNQEFPLLHFHLIASLPKPA